MGTEYPETIYHYAVRDPGKANIRTHRVPDAIVREWHIVMLIKTFSLHHEGEFHIPDEHGIKQRFYLHSIEFEDCDMLDAFGVPCVVGFEMNRWNVNKTLFNK
jgi:hypothetical protein